MTAWQPYPAYRDSVVKWLGALPTHWRTVRAKRLFRKMDRPVRPHDEVVTCFRDGTVTLRRNRRELGFTESLKEIGYQGVRRGDLVVHAMDAFAGACGVADSDGKSTPVYAVCAPKDECANSRYYAFCVREMARSQWILALSRGVRERSTDFRFAAFGNQWVPVPPSREQAAIVRFLDHADRRIQRYIGAKERLIELLEEQKQTIIQQAVTGQIDVRTGQPYPAYKDSGVELLGEVPEHWEVVALRHLATKFGSGITPRGGATVYEAKGIPFLRSQNVHFDGVRIEGVARIPREVHTTMKGTHVKPGDVLLNITGASIGRVCAVTHDLEEANVSQHVCIIRPKPERVLPEFKAAFLSTRGMQEAIELEQVGASRQGLTLDSIRSFKLFVPTVDEQRRVVAEVRTERDRLAALAGASERQIRLAREFQTRLIADVVTGKLDVRDAATTLPDSDPLAARDTMRRAVDRSPEEHEPAAQESHP